MQPQIKELKFTPKARLLLLLGDQLIRDPGIAIFELVKNSYDADSPEVSILMERIEDTRTGRIVVEDSGSGMDLKTITDVWLAPGTDHRKKQKSKGQRTPIFHRLPLGEKGVGRFAAHKLGRNIALVTRAEDCPEVFVEIKWEDFDQDEALSEIPVEVIEREPQFFVGDSTGTRIEITHLWQPWDRRMVRNLYRSVNSICSPFAEKHGFRVRFELPEYEEWLKGLVSVETVLEYALFKAHCVISTETITYKYDFTPYPAMREIQRRSISHSVTLPEKVRSDTIRDNIGSFEVDLYIYDREPAVLGLGVTDRKGLKDFLNENGGIRVYRDHVRVYDYGEPGNDWLNLDARRVNIPASRISNNIVIGLVSLNLETSKGLIEKTNREGFVENQAYQTLRDAVIYTITQVEAERKKDKDRIRNVYKRTQQKRESVLDELTELRQIIQEKGLDKEIGSLIDRIEADFILMRDQFLSTSSTGLSLSVVIHEVEKGIAELKKAVEVEPVSRKIRELAIHLADLVEGFAALIRRSGKSNERASKLIKNAMFNTQFRLKLHDITLIVDPEMEDFEITCSRRLIISTLMNLIDNSIWWLDNKWGEVSGKKQIYIGTSRAFGGDPAIVLADNGPGFIDSPDELLQPFFSRKPDGMGLGLHLADEVMKAHDGRLEFPNPEDVLLPDEFRGGAIVALRFKE